VYVRPEFDFESHVIVQLGLSAILMGGGSRRPCIAVQSGSE
jgi:hypothetical protein